MIFIPGNIPSLKNSKVKARTGIFASPTVTRFIRSLGIQSYNSRTKIVKGYVDITRFNHFELFRKEFNEMRKGKGNPIFIGYHQVRKSKRLFDFSNSVEILQDLMTAHDFIEDDNVKFVFPMPMTVDGDLPSADNIRKEEFYSVNPDNPGVWIKIF